METSGFFDNLALRAKAAITINDNDYYGEDGLIYCGDCKTPKQVRITLSGEETTFMCLCKCGKEKRDAERAAFEAEQHRIKVKELTEDGMKDEDLRHYTFENDDGSNETLINACRRYVDHFPEMIKKGKGLIFFGGVGTGKTFAAGCIANALLQKGIPVMMTSFPKIVNRFQGFREDREEYINSLSQYALLVIDDLSAERNTEYMNEIVYNVVDARYRDGKPLIITTNLTGHELRNAAEIAKQRVYSRIMEMCYPIEVIGKDRRKDKAKEEYTDMKNILGV